MDENRPVLETPTAQPKRILLEHTNGPLKGLRGIMEVKESPLPDCAQNFTAHVRQIAFASLVKVELRYALYREAPLQSDGKHFPQRVR